MTHTTNPPSHLQAIAKTMYEALRASNIREETLHLGSSHYLSVEAIHTNGIESYRLLHMVRAIIHHIGQETNAYRVIGYLLQQGAYPIVKNTEWIKTEIEEDEELEMAEELYRAIEKENEQPFQTFKLNEQESVTFEIVAAHGMSSYAIVELIRDVTTDRISTHDKMTQIKELITA